MDQQTKRVPFDVPIFQEELKNVFLPYSSFLAFHWSIHRRRFRRKIRRFVRGNRQGWDHRRTKRLQRTFFYDPLLEEQHQRQIYDDAKAHIQTIRNRRSNPHHDYYDCEPPDCLI